MSAPTPDATRAAHTFRIADRSDVAAIVDLVESAYRGDASRAGWTTEADLLGGQRTDLEAVDDLIRATDSQVVLLVADGELAACCHLARETVDSVYFGLFAVRPDAQGLGLGSAMMAEADRRTLEWGATRLRMTVISARVDLLAWYHRLGFEPTGATEPFPYGDERYGIPAVPDLEFVVLERAPALDPRSGH